MSQTVGIGMSFAARDVDADGATRVKMTYDWAAFGQDGPMGRIEYDSAKPPPHVHPAAKGFAALVGQSLTMTMASDGSVSHIEGVDALLDHVLKEISVPSEAARATLEKQLRKQFGSKAVSEMVKQMTATYPDKPVAIGGSWSKSMDVTRGFPVALDSTWTLRARRNGVATIDVKSRVRPSTNTDPVQMGPMSLTYSLKGEQTGTVQVDEASGWMLSSKLTQDISGQITATGAPGTSGPTAWPVRLKAVIEISSSR